MWRPTPFNVWGAATDVISDYLYGIDLHMQSKDDYLAKKWQIHEKCAASVAPPQGNRNPNWLSVFTGWPGLKAARAYTRLAEELATALLPPEARDLAVMARGSMGRREMVWGSDADLIVLRPRAFPAGRYRKIANAYIGSLRAAGIERVSLAKWSTVREWRAHHNIILTDIDQADRSRFVCGNRDLYASFRTELAKENISAELLYQRLLVRFFWRLAVIRQQGLFPKQPDLKLMPGGVRWGLWCAAQAAAYETVGLYRKLRRTGSQQGCVEILRDPRLTKATSFLLWLRDWNQVYTLLAQRVSSDRFSCAAQRSLAKTIGVTPRELLFALKSYQNTVLEAVEAAERRVHERYARSSCRGPAWLAAWQPVLSELLASSREERPVSQALLRNLSREADDSIFNLALAWFSSDARTLRRCASHLPRGKKLNPAHWPLVAGLTRNPATPQKVSELCQALLKTSK
jgi:hypothetical protein